MPGFTEFLQREMLENKTDEPAAILGGGGEEFETARASVSKCPLPSIGVVSFGGPDAMAFINAQFTSNCAEVTPSRGQFSGWCDPKGRVLFLITIFSDGERLYALLPKIQIEEFIARLQRYILRADVKLENLTESVSVFGISGDIQTEPYDTTGLTKPWDATESSGRTMIIRYGPGVPRFLMVGPEASAPQRWAELDRAAVSENAWFALNIVSGLPHLDERTSGQFLPQNLNLDALGALSFSKGCYPGQEIVARLKYRGKVKKRLFPAICESASVPRPGDRILMPDDDRGVGHILCAQRLDSASSVVNMVAEIDIAAGELIVEGAAGTALRLIDLPYAVD